MKQVGWILLIFLGAVLVIFGLYDLLVPRARFASSSPEPGSTITALPTSIVVKFSNELDPESTLDVVSTIRLLPSGETDYTDGKSLVRSAGLDVDDPSRKTMRAELRPGLPNGLYVVNWRTKSARWRAITFGRFYFGAGMAVPEHITRDMSGTIWERTYEQRSRRGALAGGLLLVALGLFLHFFR